MFTGLSAFPLTPFENGSVNHDEFARLIDRLAVAGVDSIGALGSTGGYAYLDREERREAARTAVSAAGATPVIVGVGAFSTRQVLQNIDDAADAGAAGLLLSVLSYQALTDDEVFSLFERANEATDLPIVLYDNPGTTGTRFTDELYARIANLPKVASIKLPGVPVGLEEAKKRVTHLQQLLPATLQLGISADGRAADGLTAGCAVWYSVLAGTLPTVCLHLTRAIAAQDQTRALEISRQLEPIWQLFTQYGSNRVVSAIAAELKILPVESLHHPVAPLTGESRQQVRTALEMLGELN